MNAVRMSHYPPDAHFLDACDELGLYVLDELGGWQKSYDTPTGRRLIGQIVRRDVNHPSIVLWDNGNEGGWNRENDGEFARWDPQKREVLHPWEKFRFTNTGHYKKFDSHTNLSSGPDIYMPTEFLHGLYDGGIGAGMWDYWELIRKSKVGGGGFFWALVDECVSREQIKTEDSTAPAIGRPTALLVHTANVKGVSIRFAKSGRPCRWWHPKNCRPIFAVCCRWRIATTSPI